MINGLSANFPDIDMYDKLQILTFNLSTLKSILLIELRSIRRKKEWTGWPIVPLEVMYN